MARESTRDRILRATLRILREDGYRAAQIAPVAAAAGVAAGTVYLHFPSKSDLCAEVFRLASAHEVAVLAEIGALPLPPAERLESAVRTFVRRALRGPRLAYALIAEPVDPAVEAERIESKRAFARVFAGILREGIERNELPEQDVDAAAACLIGALAESLVGPLTPESARIETAGRERLEEALTAFCRRAVGLPATGADRDSKALRGVA
ncbi:MAG TPA: TetR family transcriptional regulator [Alphaproteobacteria bacterium]|nr:TetR family transcriptional regulator [Alphaproteobacteria bacterium]